MNYSTTEANVLRDLAEGAILFTRFVWYKSRVWQWEGSVDVKGRISLIDLSDWSVGVSAYPTEIRDVDDRTFKAIIHFLYCHDKLFTRDEIDALLIERKMKVISVDVAHGTDRTGTQQYPYKGL